MTQLALKLEPKSLKTPDDAYDVYVAPLEGAHEPSGPLPVLASCARAAEHIAAESAGVPADRCMAIKARCWSDTLLEKLGEANRRADDDLAFLKGLHAEILGIPVDQLDETLAAQKAEEDRMRQEARAAAPARATKGKAAKGGDAIGIGRAALSERQRQLLSHVDVTNNFAVYTSAERVSDWDLLKRIMLALGGTWKTGGKKAPGGFRFPDDVDAAELVRLAKETGEITDPKAAELFETPLVLGEVAVERLEVLEGMRVLEPSAGRGALLRALLMAQPNLDIQCVEPLAENIAGKLATVAHGLNGLLGTGCCCILEGDFLRVQPGEPGFDPFDRVLMNPPFSKRQDIRHVRHAYDFLKPGGVLVAIMSAGVKHRDDKLGKEFRAFVEANQGAIWDNPDGSFIESGTGVRTVMVRVRRTA